MTDGSGGGRGKSNVCAVCEFVATTVTCQECSIVFCNGCFDRLHLRIPAVQHHQKVAVQGPATETLAPLPTSATATRSPVSSSLATPPTVEAHAAQQSSLRTPFIRPHPLRIPPTVRDADVGGNDSDNLQRKAPRTLHDQSVPPAGFLLASGGSARTRNIAPPSTAPSPHSSSFTFKISPTSASQGIQPLTPSMSTSSDFAHAGPFQQMKPSPTSALDPLLAMASIHQPPPQQKFVPATPAPPAAAADDVEQDHTLEDLFFDRFNSVNEQVDTLESQLADAVTLAMSSAAAASRIHVTRQHLQVMCDERLQALAKVVVHSPDLLQRMRGLRTGSLQNVPELWARAYQKLRTMATHLKTAQSNLVALQGHVAEFQGRPDMADKLHKLDQTIQNTRQYIATLRKTRHDECQALLSFSDPLRIRVGEELSEQRRKGLIS